MKGATAEPSSTITTAPTSTRVYTNRRVSVIEERLGSEDRVTGRLPDLFFQKCDEVNGRYTPSGSDLSYRLLDA